MVEQSGYHPALLRWLLQLRRERRRQRRIVAALRDIGVPADISPFAEHAQPSEIAVGHLKGFVRRSSPAVVSANRAFSFCMHAPPRSRASPPAPRTPSRIRIARYSRASAARMPSTLSGTSRSDCCFSFGKPGQRRGGSTCCPRRSSRAPPSIRRNAAVWSPSGLAAISR